MKFYFALFFLIFALPIFSETESETMKIKMRLNYVFDDKKNFVELSKIDDKKTENLKSSFDAVSGASTNRAARTIRAFQGEHLFPDALKNFLHFSSSDAKFIKSDFLKVEKDGAKIKILFFHRSSAFLIQTDEKGRADIWRDFQKAEVADSLDGVFSVREEFLTDGKLDFEKIAFSKEEIAEGAEKIYSGFLKIKEKNGILDISGKLQKIPAPKKEEQKENPKEKPQEKENAEDSPKNQSENPPPQKSAG